MRGLLLFLSLSITATMLHAQTIVMNDTTITTCSAVLWDSGGENGPGYGPNEQDTLRLCPAIPGHVIRIAFTLYDLPTFTPTPLDHVTIYDGTSVTGPQLGTWNGNGNPGIQQAGFLNGSGCLTVRFHSNSSFTGHFRADISCVAPCPQPTGVLTSTEPVQTCPGVPVEWDASASFAAPDEQLASYTWRLPNGQAFVSEEPFFDHAFAAAGDHLVAFYVTDTSGCVSDTTMHLVQVSTTPRFTGTTADTAVCVDEEVALIGQATATPLYSPTGMDSLSHIADDVGFVHAFPVEVSSFPEGAVLEDLSQLERVCLDLEHSFMGDLVISLNCPNGTEVFLHTQGGGGTYLGDALDLVEGPGICAGYCWTNDAVWGTWAESGMNSDTPNVEPAALDTFGMRLIPGDYTPVMSLDGLLGCPLNGTWTLELIDLWGADDGYLCGWSMGLGAVVEQGPALCVVPDLCTWSGSGVVVDAGDPSQAVLLPATPGIHEAVYTVVDELGCTHSTTVVVNAVEGPVAGAVDGPLVVEALQVVEYSTAPVPEADELVWTIPANWILQNTTETGITVLTAGFAGTDSVCVSAMVDGCAGPRSCAYLTFSTGVHGGAADVPFTVQVDGRGISVVPGPSVKGSLQVSVYDATGREVVRRALAGGSGRAFIDLGAEAGGAYHVRGVAEGLSLTRTVVLTAP